MAAITWRNVNGPTGADELRSLALASQQIGSGFDSLQKSLVNYQAEEGRQFKQRKDDNTNAFLDRLYSQYQTPEALQAAIANGYINRMRAAYGNEINAADVRGAADNLLATRRDQNLKGFAYGNAVIDQKDDPLISQAKAYALQGDEAKAKAILAEVDARNQGKAAQTIFSAGRDLTKANQEDTRFGWDGQRLESDLLTAKANRGLIAANTAGANLGNQMKQLQLSDLQDEKKADKIFGTFIQAHNQEVDKQKSAINQIAAANPSIFALRRGQVDLNSMDESQKAAANELLKKNGLSLDVYTSGDTAAAENAITQMAKAGFSPRVLKSLTEKADLFNTGGLPTSVGNDAYTRDRQRNKQEAIAAAYEEASGGTPNTLKQVNDFIVNELPKNIVDNSFFFKNSNTAQIQDVTANWVRDLKGGVPLGDGRKAFPDKSLITLAINNAIKKNPGWLSDSDIRNSLDEVTSQFAESIAKARKTREDIQLRDKKN